MMRFESRPEVQAQIEKLALFFQKQDDGVELTWADIGTRTSLRMGPRDVGRQYARRALRKLRRPYEPIWGTGLRLSAPDTAMRIVKGRVIRIDGAVRVAERTQAQLHERHLEQMSDDDQRHMLMAAGFFGAIRALASENRNRLFK